MAYTGQAWASHKEARICFALQANKGTAATTGFIEIPTKDDCDIDVSPGYSFFQMGGGFRGKTWYSNQGDTIEGKIVLPVSPGYVGAGAVYNWLFGRQDSSYYYQGYYATIYKVINYGLANEWVELYQDVKVKGGSMKLDAGLDYLTFECDLIGLCLPDVSAVTYPADAADTFVSGSLVPYKFEEASFAVDTGSGYAATVVTKNHTLTWDNMLEEVRSLAGSTVAYDAPSTEWADWTVSYDQWYTSSAVRAAFLAGTEGQYKALLTRGADICTFEMPRIKWTDAPLGVGTGGLIKQEGINFQALVALTGDSTTKACAITEVGAS